MFNRNNLNGDSVSFWVAIKSLDLYHEQIQQDANFKKQNESIDRNDQFVLNLVVYDKLKQDILHGLNLFIAEKIKERELIDKMEKHAADQDAWVRDVNVSQQQEKLKANQELQKDQEFALELKRKLEEHLRFLKGYLTDLNHFIEQTEKIIKNQKQEFIGKFTAEVKSALLEKYDSYDNKIEVEVGKQKVLIDLEDAANSLSKLMESQFDNSASFSSSYFKTEIQKQFENILSDRLQLLGDVQDKEKENIVLSAAKISDIISDKQSHAVEKAVVSDKLLKDQVGMAMRVKESVLSSVDVLQARLNSPMPRIPAVEIATQIKKEESNLHQSKELSRAFNPKKAAREVTMLSSYGKQKTTKNNSKEEAQEDKRRVRMGFGK